MPWIPHSCYVGQKQNCKAKIGSCIAYTEYRECCCDRALIRRCKYRCNDNRISFGIFNAKQKKKRIKTGRRNWKLEFQVCLGFFKCRPWFIQQFKNNTFFKCHKCVENAVVNSSSNYCRIVFQSTFERFVYISISKRNILTQFRLHVSDIVVALQINMTAIYYSSIWVIGQPLARILIFLLTTGNYAFACGEYSIFELSKKKKRRKE